MRPVERDSHIGDPAVRAVVPPESSRHPFDKSATRIIFTGRRDPLAHRWYRNVGKRILDVFFVIATLPVSVPIVLICAIALWIESGLPFYSQDRLGQKGGRFSILKLRTKIGRAHV